MNKIEVLPVSPNDEELRWAAYYKIYGDSFLSRYAPGGGVRWGHRHPFGNSFYPLGFGPLSQMEAAGDYPIHIIVRKGVIELLGIVDSEQDKTLVEMLARQVPGAFGVENHLMVDKRSE